jgi:hypothetical protein
MKGQLFSIDFMISLSIFLLTLTLVFFLIIVKPGTTNTSIQTKANQIADFLVTTKLGTENILRCTKIVDLASQSYETIRNDTGATPFDIYVKFVNSTNICSGSQTDIGSVPSVSTTIVSVVRIVNIDQNKMQMIVRLYD